MEINPVSVNRILINHSEKEIPLIQQNTNNLATNSLRGQFNNHTLNSINSLEGRINPINNKSVKKHDLQALDKKWSVVILTDLLFIGFILPSNELIEFKV